MNIIVHCENNAPFVVATEVVRIIEVSHWGNIAVEEAISVVHKGAELKVSIIWIHTLSVLEMSSNIKFSGFIFSS